MTYDEAVNWLLAHGPLDVGRTGVEARKRWGEILDALGFRQLQQNYDEACVELAKKDEREKLRQREWATEKEWADVIEERDEARALVRKLRSKYEPGTVHHVTMGDAVSGGEHRVNITNETR